MPPTNTILPAIESLREKTTEWFENPSPVWGIPTGFPSIDKWTGGLHGAQLAVMAADTGTGKSAWVAQLAIAAAEHILRESNEAGELTGVILYYTPEMTTEQLILRQACQMVGLDSLDVHQGNISQSEYDELMEAYEAYEFLNDVLIVNDDPEIGVREIIEDVDSRDRFGPPARLVIIDYLQMLDLGTLEQNRYVGMSQAAKQLKALANRQEIPVLVVSQLNREFKKRLLQSDNPESEEPDLSDLRDSGRIGELSDFALLAWKIEDLTRVQIGREQTVYFKIEKNRHGPRQIVTLGFNPVLTRYSDPEDY